MNNHTHNEQNQICYTQNWINIVRACNQFWILDHFVIFPFDIHMFLAIVLFVVTQSMMWRLYLAYFYC